MRGIPHSIFIALQCIYGTREHSRLLWVPISVTALLTPVAVKAARTLRRVRVRNEVEFSRTNERASEPRAARSKVDSRILAL